MTTEQLGQAVLASFKKMTPQEKAEVRRAVYANLTGKPYRPAVFTAADREFLRQIGIIDPCSRNALASPLEPATASGDASPL
jgi:hypothetical protein